MKKLLVFCLLILVIFLAALTVKGQPIIASFFSNGSNSSYVASLNTFRTSLPVDPRKSSVYNKPLLCAHATTNGSSRYRQVRLTNSAGIVIILGIDVTNVYVLGYHIPNCSTSHFFNDSNSLQAKRFLFTDSSQNTLPFDGSYPGLLLAGANRSVLTLGLPNLNEYITTLNSYSCIVPRTIKPPEVAKALLVTIQVIAEAARFEMIQQVVLQRMPPTITQQSLQNSWGQLSEQIQRAETNRGNFKKVVRLKDEHGNKTIIVANVQSKYAQTVKLLLNRQGKLTVALPSVIQHDGHENYATIM